MVETTAEPFVELIVEPFNDSLFPFVFATAAVVVTVGGGVLVAKSILADLSLAA